MYFYIEKCFYHFLYSKVNAEIKTGQELCHKSKKQLQLIKDSLSRIYFRFGICKNIDFRYKQHEIEQEIQYLDSELDNLNGNYGLQSWKQNSLELKSKAIEIY